MLGFAFGFACLFGFVGMARRGHGWRGGRRGRHFYRGRGRYRMLRRLFGRLDTTPSQERVIRDALDEVFGQAHALRDDLWGARSDFSEAFRGESLDVDTLAEMMSRHDDAIHALRTELVGAVAKVHEVLDPDQREQLSDFLGKRRGWRGGPYRSAAC